MESQVDGILIRLDAIAAVDGVSAANERDDGCLHLSATRELVKETLRQVNVLSSGVHRPNANLFNAAGIIQENTIRRSSDGEGSNIRYGQRSYRDRLEALSCWKAKPVNPGDLQ